MTPVRLADLTPAQRRLVLALINADTLGTAKETARKTVEAIREMRPDPPR